MIRRSNQPPQRFVRHGLLAVDPRAFFDLFMVPSSRANEQHGNVCVVEVSGPIVQRDEMWCDSYEAIRARFAEACKSEASAIVMRFDSPGGDASGCFETARALREEAAKARKPLIAYIDKACSAAYALASAASVIVIGDTCCAGSIGVMSSRPDYTAQNTQHGLRIAFVTSGARKLDGNPDYPITEEELATTQKHVDDLAMKFFALIGDMRPQQLSAAAVAAMDGGVFYGTSAVEVGLADTAATFEETLARASTGDLMTLQALQAKSDYDAARAQLAKVAKGSDANAAAAKRALAALDEGAPPKDDDKEPEGEEPDEDEPAAEGDDKEPDAEEPEEDKPAAQASDDMPDEGGKKKTAAAAGAAPAAAATALSPELALAARVHKLEAAASSRDEREQRRALLAKRPDFGPELKAALAKAPLETVREMVKTLPKGKVQKRVAAITTVAASQGTNRGPTTIAAPASETDDLDRRMGLRGSKFGCKREGNALVFGLVDDDVTGQEAPPPAAAAK